MAIANPTKDPAEQPQYTKAARPRTVGALYMRVSTKGHGQTTDTQAVALREYAERRGGL